MADDESPDAAMAALLAEIQGAQGDAPRPRVPACPVKKCYKPGGHDGGVHGEYRLRTGTQYFGPRRARRGDKDRRLPRRRR